MRFTIPSLTLDTSRLENAVARTAKAVASTTKQVAQQAVERVTAPKRNARIAELVRERALIANGLALANHLGAEVDVQELYQMHDRMLVIDEEIAQLARAEEATI